MTKRSAASLPMSGVGSAIVGPAMGEVSPRSGRDTWSCPQLDVALTSAPQQTTGRFTDSSDNDQRDDPSVTPRTDGDDIDTQRSPARRDARQEGLQDRRVRRRIGPLADDGSTTRPFCVISISPDATRRRAARRAGSISGRHVSSSPAPTALAASDGQIVASCARCDNSSRIAASNARSVTDGLDRRHASEQYRTSSQSRSHFLRHSIVRPQPTHGFDSGTAEFALPAPFAIVYS